MKNIFNRPVFAFEMLFVLSFIVAMTSIDFRNVLSHAVSVENVNAQAPDSSLFVRINANNPSNQTVPLSATAVTNDVTLAIFDFNSQGGTSTLSRLIVNVWTGIPGSATPVSNVYDAIKMKIGDRVYPGTIIPNGNYSYVVFSSTTVILPTNYYVPITILGDVKPNSNGQLNGLHTAVNLVSNSSNIFAFYFNSNQVPVNTANIISPDTIFSSGPSSTLQSVDQNNLGAGYTLDTSSKLTFESVPNSTYLNLDNAGEWGVFHRDGVPDWVFALHLDLASKKTIKSVLFTTENPNNAAFTSKGNVNGIQMYPIVLLNRYAQINKDYDVPLGEYLAGQNDLTAYIQGGSLQFKKFTFTIYFTDGTYVTTTNPGNWNSNPANKCYQFTLNLTVGSTGPDVTALQNFLNSKGFNTPVTGYFGDQTKVALMTYQNSVGLPATGFFGPLTQAKVNADCNTVSTNSIVSSLDPSSPIASTIQISPVAQTQSVLLAVFDLKSQGINSNLQSFTVNVNTTGQSITTLFNSIQIKVGSQTYSASNVTNNSVVFNNINIPLVANSYTPITVLGTVAQDTNNFLDGSTAQVSLIANYINVHAIDANYNNVPVASSTVTGSIQTFNGSGVTVSNTSATTNGGGCGPNNSGCVQQSTFSFALTAGNNPVFVSANPYSVASLNSSAGIKVIPVSLGVNLVMPGDTNYGVGASSTGSYYIPPGTTRQFTLNVIISNLTNSPVNGTVSVNSINYGTNGTSPISNIITYGLSNLLVTVQLPGNATTYTVNYTAGSGGIISGITSQTVNSGGSTSFVTAVPNSGYQFTNWSDGSTQNPRTDSNITSNLTLTANFTAVVVPPTITALTPSTNTTWIIGQTYPVTWSSANTTSSLTVKIWLMSIYTGLYYQIASNLPNTGSTQVTIQNDINSNPIPTGSYSLEVRFGPGIRSTASGVVTIVDSAPTPISTSTIPQPQQSVDQSNLGAGYTLATDSSLNFNIIPVKLDSVGAWGVFQADGIPDLVFGLHLTLGSTKTIKSVLFTTESRNNAAFTSSANVNGKQMYPIVLTNQGGQINKDYDVPLGTYQAGGPYDFTAYIQGGGVFNTYTFTVYFTDGTYVTKTISNNATQNYTVQANTTQSTLASIWEALVRLIGFGE